MNLRTQFDVAEADFIQQGLDMLCRNGGLEAARRAVPIDAKLMAAAQLAAERAQAQAEKDAAELAEARAAKTPAADAEKK